MGAARTTYTPRHTGHWCRTTLHYRGWSMKGIQHWLGEPDMYDDTFTGASYYRIERVLDAEQRRDELAEWDRAWKQRVAATLACQSARP